ncbi:LysR family transcriptional regulator substrate-binding protein [Blautia sp. MSJ-19]|uniref:LysR family transcriptional regulator substrate-binding protein n=1 Tax=Blautia sp. MSJ-19 TaxID=2841517 RepID=UPI001C0F0ECE|nr:LysR family transcriptional regulator substrate-binding protein [Blautia sp. MSJ-19]MBU5481989.1 LysR family transcriptional regulator substrate-binding protein [Blautia sp. MSJ-19]
MRPYRSSEVLLHLKQLICETKRITDNDHATLRIGYYKGYHGNELSEAIALFSEKYPTVNVEIIVGSHEELYHAMENGSVDLAVNDQRRAFSDAYHNEVLTESKIYIELSAKNPLSKLSTLEVEDLLRFLEKRQFRVLH